MPDMDINAPALINRVMPHDIKAEQSVIGAMLMNQDAITIAGNILRGGDFYSKAYGVVFDTMVEMGDEGRPVDIITLKDRLSEKDIPPEIKSLEFAGDIVAAVPTSANVKYYADIVASKAVTRRLIKICEDIANTCYSGKTSLDNILADTESKIFNLIQRKGLDDYVPIREVVMEVMRDIEMAAKNKSAITGIPTGFTQLDYKLAGLQNSDLILIAARPSMGKTALTLNIASHVAFESKLTVAIFSLEMSKKQLVNRLFALDSAVNSGKLRTGQLNESDWEALIESAGKVAKTNLIIDDTPGISINELRTKCRKYKLEHNLSLVMIDYLQLMSGSGRSGENRQQEISEISRSLKGLARDLNIPVIALSQLSRESEKRTDKRPMLSDLRESGAIEQDADVVMFIYRDEVYNKDTQLKGIAEIIIAKQRNGPIGPVELAWLPEYTKFANLDKDTEYPGGPDY